MWYNFAQTILSEDMQVQGFILGKKIMDAVKHWLKTTPPYSNYEYTGLSDAITQSRDYKDAATDELLSAVMYSHYAYNPKMYEDLLAEYGEHPAIRHIAQEYNFKTDKKAFYSEQYIKSVISEWYKTEYQISLFKQHGMRVTDAIALRYKTLGGKLCEMLLTAAQRWLEHHEYQLDKVHTEPGYWREEMTNKILKTEENMNWILNNLDVNNPNAANISIAIQMAHLSGSILEYIPEHVNQNNTNSRLLRGMPAFLNSMSDEKMVQPAEDEFRHQQISTFYPKEEHTREWLAARKKRLNVR